MMYDSAMGKEKWAAIYFAWKKVPLHRAWMVAHSYLSLAPLYPCLQESSIMRTGINVLRDAYCTDKNSQVIVDEKET